MQLMREGLQVYDTFPYAGRYEPLCVGALSNKTLATFSFWSPRHVLWLGEMWLGPWPALDEDGLPRQDEDSPWCRYTVTSSKGIVNYFYEGINSI